MILMTTITVLRFRAGLISGQTKVSRRRVLRKTMALRTTHQGPGMSPRFQFLSGFRSDGLFRSNRG
jgi:hypothetical protein